MRGHADPKDCEEEREGEQGREEMGKKLWPQSRNVKQPHKLAENFIIAAIKIYVFI